MVSCSPGFCLFDDWRLQIVGYGVACLGVWAYQFGFDLQVVPLGQHRISKSAYKYAFSTQ
jgi:hypothetical protein